MASQRFDTSVGTASPASASSGERNDPSPEIRIVGIPQPVAPLIKPAKTPTAAQRIRKVGPRVDRVSKDMGTGWDRVSRL